MVNNMILARDRPHKRYIILNTRKTIPYVIIRLSLSNSLVVDHRKDPFEGVLCCVMLLRYPVFPFRDVPFVIRNTPDILRAYVDTQHNQIHTVTKYTSNRKDHIYRKQ